jgi:4-hydroxy-tetrahydrodipicolinate synthase
MIPLRAEAGAREGEKMFSGSMTALVTPFRNGEFYEQAYRDLIDWQVASGTDGLVPCGTTGESATLSHEEHDRVVEVCIDAVSGRVPVIAGAGSNSTAEALRLTRHAREAGADGALLITPYYNKPTQEGLYQHYRHIAENVDIPIVMYNVPSRTGTNLLPETVARLADLANIVGVKEATADMDQVSRIVQLCGDRVAVISGDDFTVLPLLAVGGKGVISVVTNVAPADMATLVDAFFDGNLEKAAEMHHRISPLAAAMFLETNPIPVKTALGMMGKIDPELRLPLVPMSEGARAKLDESLRSYGLLKN